MKISSNEEKSGRSACQRNVMAANGGSNNRSEISKMEINQ
jgi:hypothetical protein